MKRTLKQSTKSNEPENPSHQKLQHFDVTNNIKNNHFLNKFDYIVLFLLILTTSTYILSYSETISWQLSSIGRILMIKVLPYYDWRPLKNKLCLVDSLFKETETISNTLNCNVCEDLIGIDVYELLGEDILEERYINLDNPVIITKGLESWPKSSAFIEEIKNEDSSKLYPCYLSTNMHKGQSDLETILSKVKYFDQFFVHYQNCELEAMRVLRKYAFRPEILPPVYSPTLYNWLIWNRNYNVTNFKRIELVEKVTAVGQLFGSTYVRLVPRKNCEHVCQTLDIVLQGGELVIFTSLWDLEYRPTEVGENMAVIMEYRD